MTDSSTPPTITDFLLARIAEDEETADAWEEGGIVAWTYTTEQGVQVRVDAARVLAECKAKRAIVERAARMIAEANTSAPYYPPEINDPAGAVEADLFDLAAVYADHPDYQQEWAV